MYFIDKFIEYSYTKWGLLMSSKNDLTIGNIGSLLTRLAIPMVFGSLGLVIFNLVDAFFIGRLGALQLAAISFTYPVILAINSITLGLGIGVSSVISRAVGSGNHHKVERLTTDSLVFAILMALLISTVGLFTIRPLFTALGANGEVLNYIEDYMSIWYFGCAFVVVPMVGNNCIRALGDTLIPGIIMMVASVANGILDYFLIFGIGPFPEMGIRGAALATVLGRSITFTVALLVLGFKYKIINVKWNNIDELFTSWREMLYIGVPSALTRVIKPLATGVITRMIASFGVFAVAGYGVGIRVEFFALVAIHALSAVMGPFVGQNKGANLLDRIRSGIKKSSIFSLIYGISMAAALFIAAPYIAAIFTDEPIVIETASLYLKMAAASYGFQGIMLICISSLNALRRPYHSAMLTLGQMVIYLLTAYILKLPLGIVGIFIGMILSYIMAAIGAWFVTNRQVTIMENTVISG